MNEIEIAHDAVKALNGLDDETLAAIARGSINIQELAQRVCRSKSLNLWGQKVENETSHVIWKDVRDKWVKVK